MRKFKLITTQDHFLVLVEVQNENQEVTCIDVDTGLRGLYPTEAAGFIADGSATVFLKFGSGAWNKINEVAAPCMTFFSGAAELGSVSTSSSYRAIGIHPKTQSTLDQWKPFLGLTDDQINTMLDPSMRESFVEIYSYTMVREMDPDTFEELASTSLVLDSEIVYL